MTDKLDQTVENLHKLSLEVTTLAGVVGKHEQGFTDIKDSIKEMAGGIKEITQTLGSFTALSEKVNQAQEDIRELKTEYRVIKHDIGNIQTNAKGFEVVAKNAANTDTRLKVLEEKNLMIMGGPAVFKWIWAAFGASIVTMFGYFLVQYTNSLHARATIATEISEMADQKTKAR